MSTRQVERVVVLQEPNDLTFMGLNIFFHDFLHDFNIVNFSARLSKISNDIDKLTNAIQNRTTITGGQVEDELFDETLVENILSENLVKKEKRLKKKKYLLQN